MKIYKNFALIILLMVSAIRGNAQDLNDQQVQRYMDSLQIVKMRDSLGVGDDAIARVLHLRLQYLRSAEQIRLNAGLSLLRKDRDIRALRVQINEAIKNALGEIAYERYLKMIATGMQKRRITGKALAGD